MRFPFKIIRGSTYKKMLFDLAQLRKVRKENEELKEEKRLLLVNERRRDKPSPKKTL